MNSSEIIAEFACVLLFDKQDRILLIQRHQTGWLDGHWGFPGGGIEKAESIQRAAVREAHEEVGVTIGEHDLSLIHTIILKHSGKSYKGYFLATQQWFGEPSLQEPHKCSAINWFSVTKLPETIIPSARHVIECKGQCSPELVFES